jgi:hypothetical protein
MIASSLFRKMWAERSSLIYASVAATLNEYLSR